MKREDRERRPCRGCDDFLAVSEPRARSIRFTIWRRQGHRLVWSGEMVARDARTVRRYLPGRGDGYVVASARTLPAPY